MRTNDLVRFTSDILERKPGTVSDYVTALQASGLIRKGSRGRYSGVDMTESDGINALLAAALDHPRGECIGASVTRIRSTPMSSTFFNPLQPGRSVKDNMTSAFQFVRGLAIKPLDDVGAVLDGLVRDIRSGAFAEWSKTAAANISVDFHDNGRSVFVTIDCPTVNESAVFGFEGTQRKATGIERIFRIHQPVLHALANALGPIAPPSG